GMHAALNQVAFESLCDGRLAGARKPSQPNHRSPMTAAHCPCARRNFSLRPEDVLALCDGPVRINAAENRAATADLSVVYDNKAAEIRNTLVVVNHEWAAGLNCKATNLVSLQLFTSVGFCLQC